METTIPISLSALSHNLRTPLTGILGVTHFLIKENLTPTQKNYATIISKEAKHLVDVVNMLTASGSDKSASSDTTHCAELSYINATKSRVLLVEDNPLIQKLHSRMLREMDCQFDVASDAQQALSMVFNAAGDANYDVILMDINLGDSMTGIEAAAQIRQCPGGKKIRIIALSATAEEEVKDDCLAAQIDGFINKPIDAERLERLIDGE
jgi:CheY-like chemotaxis protein